MDRFAADWGAWVLWGLFGVRWLLDGLSPAERWIPDQVRDDAKQDVLSKFKKYY